MRKHIAREGETAPACGSAERGEPVIPSAEVMDPEGRYFDCVDCHRALTGGQRHSRPDGGER